MDFSFFLDALMRLVPGVPLTLQLAFISVGLGMLLALMLALLRLSGSLVLQWIARAYIFAFRSTPLLVQIFLLYYGLGQFEAIRYSVLWPILRQPYWCAIIALALNTAAYGSEIIRGGLQSVPEGQIEAARACGMGRLLVFRRIILPLAIRQALPAYGNEVILMVKATALASVITMMEITGLAAKLISESYRAVEVFIVAGSIYLAINYVITRIIHLLEYRLTPHLTSAAPAVIEREDAT
ncbi:MULTISPECIES: ABC transporter permease [unclassified Mesorhizobium]|uniref:ABC transporter permease n=1 Tax=unclassified Mesorhizobium TaxID=325217 RepID=UPI001093DDB7|nr:MULTISPECIES: ABC transporter permease [unclassified Mesorhizobium]TGT91286.1 ABC transporter permease [Mesorhizobium sp. M8A.F.Ca.ET.161.01.1.1]TGV43435.1 ABC transporter permease [Mesorhizobium sp. M8A.F.Ca.ET.142.01.1.1]